MAQLVAGEEQGVHHDWGVLVPGPVSGGRERVTPRAGGVTLVESGLQRFFPDLRAAQAAGCFRVKWKPPSHLNQGTFLAGTHTSDALNLVNVLVLN